MCKKRGNPLNLPIRLEERHEEIMGFFERPGVPFDNKQAERDLRMMKVREKISGTFRSEKHAEAFCDPRAVLSSASKQDATSSNPSTNCSDRPRLSVRALREGNYD